MKRKLINIMCFAGALIALCGVLFAKEEYVPKTDSLLDFTPIFMSLGVWVCAALFAVFFLVALLMWKIERGRRSTVFLVKLAIWVVCVALVALASSAFEPRAVQQGDLMAMKLEGEIVEIADRYIVIDLNGKFPGFPAFPDAHRVKVPTKPITIHPAYGTWSPSVLSTFEIGDTVAVTCGKELAYVNEETGVLMVDKVYRIDPVT